MPFADNSHVPGSTYRVQLQGKFTFADLGTLVPYFSALGISHFYLSPIFSAMPGSTHGYDVRDYGTINPELGGSDGFELLASRVRRENLSLLVDFVPNHMGIAGLLNDWWRDVLEFGRRSPYEGFFDIQWNQEVAGGRPRVLVPILEDHYGKVLEEGKISVAYREGEFSLQYADIFLPINPAAYPGIIAPLAATAPDELSRQRLLEIVAGFASSDAGPVRNRQDHDGLRAWKDSFAALLAGNAEWQKALAVRLIELNGHPGEPANFAGLHELIEQQHYRLARWKTGTHEINYRRFFAIDSLVGLHMERPEVFRACHELVGRLIREGKVSGLRIDHIDGLRQPEDYLKRLQLLERPAPDRPLYVLVEKILARDESLPSSWPVHGTTGYEFIDQVAGLMVEPSAESRLNSIYRGFTGDRDGFPEIVHAKKRMIIAEMFYNAASNLGANLVDLLSADRRWRDLTRHELTFAVTEFMANLPVYRTYRRRQDPVSTADRAALEEACTLALARNPRADPEPFHFLRDLLIGLYPPDDVAPEFRADLLKWVLTFQQYTGAVMAKAVEDTAFYTYNRMLGLNEVGGTAEYPDTSSANFHATNLRRLVEMPHSLLTTSTHDTKVSEDVRARLYALSELPGEWAGWLEQWQPFADRYTSITPRGAAPDAQDLYRFWQTLLGVWPLSPREINDELRSRLRAHLQKAVSEAKRHTSILQANETYLGACDRFVEGLLRDSEFIASFGPCARRIARLGWVNSLSQLILKCTVPGVPDFYQGNEIWDFSLVDPDNRRSVDFAQRQRLQAEIAAEPLTRLVEQWHTGGIKLRVTERLLTFRRAHPGLFADGSYAAVPSAGEYSNHVIAFTRRHLDRTLLVAVPRLCAKLGSPPLGPVWEDTILAPTDRGFSWEDLFGQRTVPADEPLALRRLFADAPFAVLISTAVTATPPRP